MQAHGLKPWDEDDIQEAHAIVQTMAREDERQQGRYLVACGIRSRRDLG